MGCGSSSQTTEPSPTRKHGNKKEFESLNVDQEVSTTEEPRDVSPSEPDVIENSGSVSNVSNKNSPKGSPQQTPRSKDNRSNKKNKSKYQGDEDSQVTNTESTDKGFKKRVRQKLLDATKDGTMEDIVKMMELFEKHKLEDCGDLTKARDRYQFMKLRRDLRDSIRRRHAGVLDKTIQEARDSKFADRLRSQIEVAEKLRNHLLELNSYSHEICKMEQSTISELRSYQRPPSSVHDVMASTYLLMGYSEDRLSDWNEIQAFLGQLTRDKLIRQVGEFDTNNVDIATAVRVKGILDNYSLEEVKGASYGAATFFVWANNVVEKIQKDNQNQTGNNDDARDSSEPPPSAGSVKKKG